MIVIKMIFKRKSAGGSKVNLTVFIAWGEIIQQKGPVVIQMCHLGLSDFYDCVLRVLLKIKVCLF